MLPISKMIAELVSLIMFGATIMVWTFILSDPVSRELLMLGFRIMFGGGKF